MSGFNVVYGKKIQPKNYLMCVCVNHIVVFSMKYKRALTKKTQRMHFLKPSLLKSQVCSLGHDVLSNQPELFFFPFSEILLLLKLV